MASREPIVIDSYDALLASESELMARIAEIPNGGMLYLLHPLLLLAEVGAQLKPEVEEEFAARHGGSGGWSEEPYRALRASQAEQSCEVLLRGLFRRETE